jgi:hypothetical protein
LEDRRIINVEVHKLFAEDLQAVAENAKAVAEANRAAKAAGNSPTRTERGLTLGEPWWESLEPSTVVSKFFQVLEHGRLIISSAKKEGFGNLEFINPRIGEEGLQNQIRKCTASILLLPYSDLGVHDTVQEYRNKVLKLFYKGENKCHSRLYFNHANFRAPKGMSERYRNVASTLGVGLTLRSVSAFRTKALAAAAEKAVAPPPASPPATTATVPTSPVPATVAAPLVAPPTHATGSQRN